MTDKITAVQLREALLGRYERPEWHVEHEVTLNGRRLDVVALNLWGARSYRIVGFEIKASRGDWLHELNQFQKSEDWNAVVDAFWIVTPPDLVKPGELPNGWGLLELRKTRLITKQHARVREGERMFPREVACRFLDRIGKRLEDQHRKESQHLRAQIRAELKAEVQAKTPESVTRTLADDLTEVTRKYNELVRALGASPHEWRVHTNVLRALSIFAQCEGSHTQITHHLESSAAFLERNTKAIRDVLQSLDGKDHG